MSFGKHFEINNFYDMFWQQISGKSPHSSCENDRRKLQAQNFLTFEVISTQGTRPKETDVTGEADEHKDYLDNNHGSRLKQSSFLKVASYEFFAIFRRSCRF